MIAAGQSQEKKATAPKTPVLVLERTDGAQMPGLVTQSAAGLNFKLYGGPADDPGLDFKT